MRTHVVESISEIDSESWNGLLACSNPFLRHEFLAALESTGCASAETGWQPCHIVCESDDGKLAGALPLYLKNNSYGEFVFDFSWANAYHQAGLSYYPKLVSAIPFTPATGPRILTSPTHTDPALVTQKLLDGAINLAGTEHASSLHILFTDDAQTGLLEQSGLLRRKDCQFHWHNNSYKTFDDFLGQFTAVKRKKTKRERRRIRESGIEFKVRNGNELEEHHWHEIMPLYASTFLRRGREPYLSLDCFTQLAQTMPENIVVFMGYEGSSLVAISICFKSDTTLYGRYWGASRFVDSLHFETCYYQGIDYCIERGLQIFEPGTQGEHKISRGFIPTETWSTHWLSRPEFAVAIDDYLSREREHIDSYIDAANEHVPYRND